MARHEPRFEAHALLDCLAAAPAGKRSWVALSGGADSTALLVAAHEASQISGQPLAAAHVNHEQHPSATSWQDACRALCDRLGVPLTLCTVAVTGRSGEGLEGEMRRLRYEALGALLAPEEQLLTAHHREDQAETLLLNLMRGSGLAGLSGMAAERPLGDGTLRRPLLRFSRASLEAFLRDRDIPWCKDDSNDDVRFDRNYLRHTVLPDLESRWPHAVSALVRSADWMREAYDLQAQLLQPLLQHQVLRGRLLDLDPPGQWRPEWFHALLRQWLHEQQAPALPAARLAEFHRQCTSDPVAGHAQMDWCGWRLDQDGATFWLTAPGQQPPDCSQTTWTKGRTHELGEFTGELVWHGTPPDLLPLVIGPGRGSDRIRLGPSAARRSLKTVMRASGIPPRLRPAIPVLRREGHLLAIGDWALDEAFASQLHAAGARLEWCPRSPLLSLARERAWSVATTGLVG